MQFRRLSAFLLTVTILLSCLAGCPAAPASPTTEPTQATTEPSTIPTTLPTEPSTEPSSEPTAEPTTEPTTEATAEPTVEPTTEPKPTQPPAPTEPLPPEPWSSQTVYIGPDISGISVKKAFVFDCASNTYLYQKSELNAKLYPASITKLMNVYTALKILDLDTVITVDAGMMSLVPGDTSKAGFYAGDKMTIYNVILGTLVASGSDAAHILAVSAGRVLAGDPNLPAQQAEDLFVEEMNRQVANLGLINTHFVNCDGYTDYYHYTCMADLVTIATHVLNTPVMRDIICNHKVKMYYADGRHRTLTSTNYLLNPNSSFHRAEARGMKTGTTNAAGACLLSAFWVNDRYILIGVFQGPTFNSRYQSATKLFDYFKNTPVTEPTDPSEPPTEEPTEEPTLDPTVDPSTDPTMEPTVKPSTDPTVEPSTEPATEPSTEPSSEPSSEPSAEPSLEPTMDPIPTE